MKPPVILRRGHHLIARAQGKTEQHRFDALGGVASQREFLALAAKGTRETRPHLVQLRHEHPIKGVGGCLMPLPPSLDEGVIHQRRGGLDSPVLKIENRAIHRPRRLHVAPKALVRRQDCRFACAQRQLGLHAGSGGTRRRKSRDIGSDRNRRRSLRRGQKPSRSDDASRRQLREEAASRVRDHG